ncbi:MAG: L-rhamnose isomerase [Hominenteromicrobium sp.]
MTMYEEAKKRYAELGVDVEAAMETLAGVPISIHCWQGDDVHGFENGGAALSGGIQTTGDYPGRARCFEELCADFLKAAEQIPGKKRINLHASYLVSDTPVDRNEIEYKHFEPWVEFAKAHGFGIDFNPTYFSHPMVKDNLTLSSPDETVRGFWVEHGKRCRRIAGEISKALGTPVLNNIWIPDGFKDVPADRMTPRLRLKKSLDEIFEEKIEGVVDCVESKVFGIGLESCTVGSAEFYLSYAASHPGVYDLLDNGHYHPTEFVSDKIPAFLCFFDKVPLHVTRPVRWDSDHVVLFDDELREIAKEIVRNDALDRVMIGLDFFDASINRVAAWVVGTRNMEKALLFALLQPAQYMKSLQDSANFTELMMLSEKLKTMPFSAVWERYCETQGVPADDADWFRTVMDYEKNVLSKR